MILKANFKITLFLFCFLANTISAQTIKAIKSDLWSLPGTWDLGRTPLPGDIVEIDGFQVDLNESTQVTAINITNLSGTGKTKLNVDTGLENVVEISGDVTVTSYNENQDVELKFAGSDSTYIGGNLTITRTSDNINDKYAALKLNEDAKLTVQKDFRYDFLNSGANENKKEIHVHGNAKFEVIGNTIINIADGNEFEFIVDNSGQVKFESAFGINMTGANTFLFSIDKSSIVEFKEDCSIVNSNAQVANSSAKIEVGNMGGELTILGNLNLESTVADQLASFLVNGNSSMLSVRGNINMDGTDAGDVGGDIENKASVHLGGSISRQSVDKYGYIAMESDANWIYDGTSAQTIACTEIGGNGNDAFNFANVEFKNTSGQPLLLEGELLVENELMLEKGIIQTSAASPLIVADQAIISGGSELAYIDGPIIKRGRTGNSGFTFPTGDEGVYAPLSISEVTSNNAEYSARFLSCPPPLSGSLHSSVVTVSGTGHWEFDRGATSPDANVTLHWTNDTDFGITDPNDLVVARYDTDIKQWKSIGNGGAVSNGDGSGSVVNALTCPPPLSGSLLAFGSKGGTNALPVVLSAFEVLAKGEIVEISWQTASEVNSDFFQVERSSDGVNFKEIMKVDAAIDSREVNNYFEKDMNPENGINYYRLCQVDLMGMKVYSRVLLIDFQSASDFTIFPNPVTDQLHIRGNFEEKVYELEFFDTVGKLLNKTPVLGESGFLQLQTAGLDLPQGGMYFIRIKHGQRHETIPFIKD